MPEGFVYRPKHGPPEVLGVRNHKILKLVVETCLEAAPAHPFREEPVPEPFRDGA